MARSSLRFNLYWGWLLIFFGFHESQVADPVIEAALVTPKYTLPQASVRRWRSHNTGTAVKSTTTEA